MEFRRNISRAAAETTHLAVPNGKVSWNVMIVCIRDELKRSELLLQFAFFIGVKASSQNETTTRRILDTIRLMRVKDHYKGDKFHEGCDTCLFIGV